MLFLYVSILVCLCVCVFASMWYACGEGLVEELPHAVAVAMQRYQLGLGQLKAYGQKREGARVAPSVYKDSIPFLTCSWYRLTDRP